MAAFPLLEIVLVGLRPVPWPLLNTVFEEEEEPLAFAPLRLVLRRVVARRSEGASPLVPLLPLVLVRRRRCG